MLHPPAQLGGPGRGVDPLEQVSLCLLIQPAGQIGKARHGQRVHTRSIGDVYDIDAVRALRDEWYAVGTSTEPADRVTAEAGVTGLYAWIGESAPAMVWADSPLAAARRAQEAQGPSQSLQSLREAWQAAAKRALEGLPEGHSQRELELRTAIRSMLGETLERSVGQTIEAALRAESVGNVEDALWGQQDAGWIAWQDARRRLGLVPFTAEASALLDLWVSVARSCGWLWPYQGKCFFSERPASVVMEPCLAGQAHRLHRADGPALSFRDGWEIYAWRGGFVGGPEVSVEAILAEPTFQARQRGIERMGWHRFLAEAAFVCVGPRVPAPDEDNGTVTLYEVPQRLFGRPARLLVWVARGERDVFFVAVPPGQADPVEAYEWAWDQPDDELVMFEISALPGDDAASAAKGSKR
jgi:hypothetical protein